MSVATERIVELLAKANDADHALVEGYAISALWLVLAELEALISMTHAPEPTP